MVEHLVRHLSLRTPEYFSVMIAICKYLTASSELLRVKLFVTRIPGLLWESRPLG
jgi:hypothetical protein